ncbi:MAG TPA: hypothetical protein P5548_04110 [Candidatus Moranbacteria bacterium]|nr:hypothetical protein [Candidatus Moranbacteria bacterium]
MKRMKKNKNGYVLIYSVIILGMVVLTMAIYLSWLAVFSLQEKKESADSKTAQSLADTCAENALMAIWNNSNASGTTTRNNLFGGSGSCSYAIIIGTGEARTINATGTIDNITRKTKILVDTVISAVHYTSWREVADF